VADGCVGDELCVGAYVVVRASDGVTDGRGFDGVGGGVTLGVGAAVMLGDGAESSAAGAAT
jgi:hypothetical protein